MIRLPLPLLLCLAIAGAGWSVAPALAHSQAVGFLLRRQSDTDSSVMRGDGWGHGNPGSSAVVDDRCAGSFDKPTYQRWGTWACWILSVLEGARAQGILTATNLCNKYSMHHKTKYVPAWQELAQHQMAQETSCFDVLARRKSWQQKVMPATMSCHRDEVLPKKFATFGLNVTCNSSTDIYYADDSIAKEKANQGFFTEMPRKGEAFIYTIDRGPYFGKHAMSVRGIAKKGGKYILTLFNQNRNPHWKLSRYISKWEVHPLTPAEIAEPKQKRRPGCKCIKNCSKRKGKYCFTIYRYRVHNPAPGALPRPPADIVEETDLD